MDTTTDVNGDGLLDTIITWSGSDVPLQVILNTGDSKDIETLDGQNLIDITLNNNAVPHDITMHTVVDDFSPSDYNDPASDAYTDRDTVLKHVMLIPTLNTGNGFTMLTSQDGLTWTEQNVGSHPNTQSVQIGQMNPDEDEFPDLVLAIGKDIVILKGTSRDITQTDWSTAVQITITDALSSTQSDPLLGSGGTGQYTLVNDQTSTGLLSGDDYVSQADCFAAVQSLYPAVVGGAVFPQVDVSIPSGCSAVTLPNGDVRAVYNTLSTAVTCGSTVFLALHECVTKNQGGGYDTLSEFIVKDVDLDGHDDIIWAQDAGHGRLGRADDHGRLRQGRPSGTPRTCWSRTTASR